MDDIYVPRSASTERFLHMHVRGADVAAPSPSCIVSCPLPAHCLLLTRAAEQVEPAAEVGVCAAGWSILLQQPLRCRTGACSVHGGDLFHSKLREPSRGLSSKLEQGSACTVQLSKNRHVVVHAMSVMKLFRGMRVLSYHIMSCPVSMAAMPTFGPNDFGCASSC